MAQIQISKDPSGQIAVTLPHAPMLSTKLPILLAITRNCTQPQPTPDQIYQRNKPWILNRPLNMLSIESWEDIEKLV